MKKRPFQIFDDMNVADEANKTALLGVCNHLVEARTAKGGGHVTIGVPLEVVHRLLTDTDCRVILLVYSHNEYKIREDDL